MALENFGIGACVLALLGCKAPQQEKEIGEKGKMKEKRGSQSPSLYSFAMCCKELALQSKVISMEIMCRSY